MLSLLAATSTFLLFYRLAVFALSSGTSKLGDSRQEFLELQMLAVMLFALAFALAPLFGSVSTSRITSSLGLGFVRSATSARRPGCVVLD